MRVFRLSGLDKLLNEDYFINNTHLLADSAYCIHKHVMVPFRDNGHLTDQQTLYNTILSSARMMVERAIGLLKNRWRSLLDKLPMTTTRLVAEYIIAFCVLHNICILQNDLMEFPLVVDNDLPDPIDDDNALNAQEGQRKRLVIMNQLS